MLPAVAQILLLLALTGTDSERLVSEEARAPQPGLLRVVLECSDCDQGVGPSLDLLWPAATPAAGTEGTRKGLVTRDWEAGAFALVTRADSTSLQALRVGEAWVVDIPLDAEGLPFRVTASLVDHVALPGALWPAEQLQLQVRVRFEPVRAFLKDHPEWSPSRADDCWLVVPGGLEPPHVIIARGEPRAWLYPDTGAGGQGGEGAWTFQFVRPGGTLLERVSLPAEAWPDGDGLAFRLPLVALQATAAAARGEAQERVPLTLRGGGDLDLGDCPRAPLRAADSAR